MSDAPAQDNEALTKIVRNIHRNYPSGLTIVTAFVDDQPQGLAVSAFSSVSLDPPTVLVLVSYTSSNHKRFYVSDVLGINLVSTDQVDVARRFAQSGGDKFAGIAWHRGKYGAPILDNSLGYFEIEIRERVLAHTHTIFIGRVLQAGFRAEADPLIYVRGGFFDGAKLIDLEGRAQG